MILNEIPKPSWEPPKHIHRRGYCGPCDGYTPAQCGLVEGRDPEPPDVISRLYDRIEQWQREFYAKAATGSHASVEYYRDAASGLGIALQEIDRKRYDATSAQIWSAYQAALDAKEQS